MIPANMFIFDPIKHNRKCVALLENDSECCSEFTVVQDVFQHNPTDSYVRKIHRMYFALHCETLQRMNDRQFLTRIDINPERLTFNVKLRSIKHDLIIGPNTPYEPEWVKQFDFFWRNCLIHNLHKNCLFSHLTRLTNFH